MKRRRKGKKMSNKWRKEKVKKWQIIEGNNTETLKEEKIRKKITKAERKKNENICRPKISRILKYERTLLVLKEKQNNTMNMQSWKGFWALSDAISFCQK